MQRRVFIPLSDELLFDHPERIAGPLVPYAPGMTINSRHAARAQPPVSPRQANPSRDKYRAHR